MDKHLNLNELLRIARSELKNMTTLDRPDFRLEQAEYLNDKKLWEIVVSYLVENTNPRNSPLAAMASDFKFYRIYKRLKIDDNGNIIGFYLYEKS